jgi:hypothetical protein
MQATHVTPLYAKHLVPSGLEVSGAGGGGVLEAANRSIRASKTRHCLRSDAPPPLPAHLCVAFALQRPGGAGVGGGRRYVVG